MNTDKVTRVEIIDHTKCDACRGTGIVSREKYTSPICAKCGGSGMPGRSVIFWNADKQIDLELQDDERTLKVFIRPRYENGEK